MTRSLQTTIDCGGVVDCGKVLTVVDCGVGVDHSPHRLWSAHALDCGRRLSRRNSTVPILDRSRPYLDYGRRNSTVPILDRSRLHLDCGRRNSTVPILDCISIVPILDCISTMPDYVVAGAVVLIATELETYLSPYTSGGRVGRVTMVGTRSSYT